MKLAKKIHRSLTNGSNAHEVLDLFNKVKDKNILAEINEFFMEEYNMTPNEFITEKYKVKEVYAISSTLKCIREPNKKNTKARNKFYKEIGYKIPSS